MLNQTTKIVSSLLLLVATTTGWSVSLTETNGLNGWLIAIGASAYGLCRSLEVPREDA